MEGSDEEDEGDKSSDGEDSEESDVGPKKRPVGSIIGLFLHDVSDILQRNARNCITAFLQDQSSDDE